uniref:Uncharacterized protein n=1 Tax=Tanacetum cinerariifolium TaxID=118510 RepID=A0A6L2MVC8_TANCI|nr:hypothetical protein [Tanacetum cinerariifolium]
MDLNVSTLSRIICIENSRGVTQIVDKCKTGLRYNGVPPPYIGNFMPSKPDLSFSCLEEVVNEPIVSEPTVKKPIVETSEAKASTDKPKVQDLHEKGVIDSGRSRHVTRNMSYLTDYEEIDEGYVAYGDFKLTDESHSLLKVPRKNIMYSVDLKNIITKGGKAIIEIVPRKDYILLPLWTGDPPFFQSLKSSPGDGLKPLSDDENKVDEASRQESQSDDQEKADNTKNFNTVSLIINVAGINGVNVVTTNTRNELSFDPDMPDLEDISTFNFSNEDDGAEADMNNLDTTIQIIMENLPPPNDNQNAPEEEPFMDQAPAGFDGFAPHWFEVNKEVMDDDDWDVEVEWLMAPVTPPRATMTVSSTYEVGGPSTAAIEGPSFPLPAPGLPVPPTVIGDLGNRLGNLEYRHGVLMRKMEEVSDAEVANSIVIEEIHPRVAIVKEQVQTLQTTLHETELQNQQLRTRVAEIESHMGIVIPYMLWMEERLTFLEKRLLGLPPGPQ